MSGDHLERLAAFVKAWESHDAEHGCRSGYIMPPKMPKVELGLTQGVSLDREDLRAALDELERLRLFEAAIIEAQVSLQSSAFYVGWLKGFNAMPTAGVYTQAHLDTVEYAEEIRALNAAAPQQLAQPCPSTAVPDETKGESR